MGKDLRTCVICQSKYEYCPKCNRDVDKPTWYFIFCSENCKSIYEVMSAYECGDIDAKTANESLIKLNVSKIDNLEKSYKSTLAKIDSELKETQSKTVVDEKIESETQENKSFAKYKNIIKK